MVTTAAGRLHAGKFSTVPSGKQGNVSGFGSVTPARGCTVRSRSHNLVTKDDHLEKNKTYDSVRNLEAVAFESLL